MVSRVALIGLALFLPGIANAKATSCAERLLPSASAAAGSKRPITARDLVELRDFGRPDTGAIGEPFNLSPDGRHAALTLRRGNPDSDDYCVGVVLVTLDGRAPARLLNVGGDIVPSTYDLRGLPAIPNGSPKAATPIWSPDSKRLAWLRRDRGATQVWLVGLDGRPATQLTRLSTDALSIAWAKDGRTILVKTRPLLDAGFAAIEREGRSGYHYDARFASLFENRPRPSLPLPEETSALDVVSGAVRPLSPAEAARMMFAGEASRPPGATLFAEASSGDRAWTALADPEHPYGPDRLHVVVDGKEIACTSDVCDAHIGGLWWISPGELLIERYGGPENGGRVALFRWRPAAEAAPSMLFDTVESLTGCQPLGRDLICARETAIQPRMLARLDPETGVATTLYDPNPEFAFIRMGSVERLVWTDREGVPTFGDLVLPPDHKPGERHPLIVVQYQSRGFLRGGTGDEYPIFLYAAKGYAVLSFQAPNRLPATDAAPDLDALQRINVRDWAGRRRIFLGLDAGVDMAITRGSVDEERVGITGLSDGGSTVQYALNNSSRFKAAVISSCCDDPSTMFTVGPAYRDAALRWGYPPPGQEARAFWAPQSLATNATRLTTPLLMQLSDAEYRMATEGFSALESAGAPVEMYVFPDEQHVKAHPAHRLAVYERGIAWFDFWLRDMVSNDLARQPELARWQTMKARVRSAQRLP